MVFEPVVSNGSVMGPHFIGYVLKIGTKERLYFLKNFLLFWMKQKLGLNNVVLTYYSTQCHGPKVTQVFLGEKVPSFVRANNWLSNSPNLDLFDYCL